MPAILALIEEPALKQLASPEGYTSGSALARSGVVDLTEVSPLKIRAEVKDDQSQSYVEVKLIAAMGRLIYSCTCDHASADFCQHCVAVALATTAQAEAKRSDEPSS